MALSQQEHVDTVIIGNGPSALILSYILHGHIPLYNGGHSDASLHNSLRTSRNLLDLPLSAFAALTGSLQYTTQALPINILLDTLLRPGGDTSATTKSCVQWQHHPDKAVKHLVLGDAPTAGGQWAANPVQASADIGTLSYAEQLSLPGYTISEFWKDKKEEHLPELTRPSRADIAGYYATYPKAVGIEETLRSGAHVRGIHRTPHGFVINSHHVVCKRLVLASGVYTINKSPPPLLSPLSQLSLNWKGPILVIGSGFTAADIIISSPPDRKILHIYNWNPEKHPSPLKACHPTAYPEYAAIYLFMKSAAERLLNGAWKATRESGEKLISSSASSLPTTFTKRSWALMYEGLPNARIMSTGPDDDGSGNETPKYTTDEKGRRRSLFHSGATRKLSTSDAHNEPTARSLSVDAQAHTMTDPIQVIAPQKNAATIRIGYSSIGESIGRTISDFHYVAGRVGSLAYLSPILLHEVLPVQRQLSLQADDIELAPLPQLPHENHHRTSSETSTPGASTPRRQSESDLHDFATEFKIRKAVVTHSTLRPKVEEPFAVDPPQASHEVGRLSVDYRPSNEQLGMLEMAKDVFVIGSLTGDTLVRFAYGGCCAVAGKLMSDNGITHGKGDPLPEFEHTRHDSTAQEPVNGESVQSAPNQAMNAPIRTTDPQMLNNEGPDHGLSNRGPDEQLDRAMRSDMSKRKKKCIVQ